MCHHWFRIPRGGARRQRGAHDPAVKRARHLVQYWHSANPPEDVALLCETFHKQNPNLRYVLFSESSAEELIADHFSGRECAAFRACAVRAMEADYFRYCAVLAQGGIYSDVDYRCVAPLAPLLDGAACGKLYIRPNGIVINAFFAFARSDEPLLRYALEIATRAIELRLAEDLWLTTGPGIFTMLYHLSIASSVDEFLGWWPSVGDENDREDLRKCAQNVCNVVGDLDQLRLAFSDIDIDPISETHRWVQDASVEYKESEGHWSEVTSSIFR